MRGSMKAHVKASQPNAKILRVLAIRLNEGTRRLNEGTRRLNEGTSRTKHKILTVLVIRLNEGQ